MSKYNGFVALKTVHKSDKCIVCFEIYVFIVFWWFKIRQENVYIFPLPKVIVVSVY